MTKLSSSWWSCREPRFSFSFAVGQGKFQYFHFPFFLESRLHHSMAASRKNADLDKRTKLGHDRYCGFIISRTAPLLQGCDCVQKIIDAQTSFLCGLLFAVHKLRKPWPQKLPANFYITHMWVGCRFAVRLISLSSLALSDDCTYNWTVFNSNIKANKMKLKRKLSPLQGKWKMQN